MVNWPSQLNVAEVAWAVGLRCKKVREAESRGEFTYCLCK